MSIVSYALKGNLNNFLKKLDVISKEEKISKFKLFNKFLYCFINKGFGYSDYLNYELYLKTKKEIKEYVSIKDQDKFYEIVSPSKYKTYFTIKPNFLNNFKEYINRDYFYKGSLEELKKFLKKHNEFMIKPIDGLGGKGVNKLYTKDIKNIDEFYNKLNNENLFLEEYIIQHSKINELAPNSVNTIRIMTYNYNSNSEILFAALRVGNGANVDNFHQGGMGVLIDIESGKLMGEAIDKDLHHFKVHPTSKIKFEGFIIPNWEIIKNTVLEAAKKNKNIHVVGWDVAVTNEGCTLIEGNRRPGFDLPQVLAKKGRMDMIRDVITKINKEENTNYKI